MGAAKDLGPLDWRTPIVDGSGRPSPEFQRRWNTQRDNNGIFGTVTAVSATAVLPLVVRVSTPASTPAIALSFSAQAANLVFCGPASGLSAAPGFRSLVPADLPVFTTAAAGAVPASGGGTTNFLRADGSWAAPPGGGGGGALGMLPLVNGATSPTGVMSDTAGQTIGVQLGTTLPAPNTKILAYLAANTLANRPANPGVAAGAAAIYFATDTGHVFVWTGATWVQIL